MAIREIWPLRKSLTREKLMSFLKKYFSFKLKSVFESSQVKKSKKNFFEGQIGLEFIAHHDQPVGCTFESSTDEKKSNSTIFSCSKRKIF